MTWVKICGLRTADDVVAAQEAGADAVGFVVSPSPRRVSVEEAGRLVALTSILPVVVTLDLPAAEVGDLIARTGTTALQPHGRHRLEVAEAARDMGCRVLLPVPTSGSVEWEAIPDWVTPLVDAPRPGRGIPVDWRALGRPQRDFILAGGLTPDNVVEAVSATGAWGVDVSTGVESFLGRKDPTLISRFVERAKA